MRGFRGGQYWAQSSLQIKHFFVFVREPVGGRSVHVRHAATKLAIAAWRAARPDLTFAPLLTMAQRP